MNTDQMIKDDVQETFEAKADEIERLRFETLPVVGQPAPVRVMRPSGIAGRLRTKKTKAQIFLKSIQFASQLIQIKMHGKPLQKSVKLQYHLSTRTARAAVNAAKPKKHRVRR